VKKQSFETENLFKKFSKTIVLKNVTEHFFGESCKVNQMGEEWEVIQSIS
jgi:hypothetical protein